MKEGEGVNWRDLVVLIPALIAVCLAAFKLHPGLQLMRSFLESVDVELLFILLSPLIASLCYIAVAWPRCDAALRRVYFLTRDGGVRVVRCLLPWPRRWSDAINPHELYVGGSGAGKSNALKVRIARLMDEGVESFLVIDWSGEYGYLKGFGFEVVDVSRVFIDLFRCVVGDVVDAASLAFYDSEALSSTLNSISPIVKNGGSRGPVGASNV